MSAPECCKCKTSLHYSIHTRDGRNYCAVCVLRVGGGVITVTPGPGHPLRCGSPLGLCHREGCDNEATSIWPAVHGPEAVCDACRAPQTFDPWPLVKFAIESTLAKHLGNRLYRGDVTIGMGEDIAEGSVRALLDAKVLTPEEVDAMPLSFAAGQVWESRNGGYYRTVTIDLRCEGGPRERIEASE